MKVYALQYGDADLNDEEEGVFSTKKKALAEGTRLAEEQLADDDGDDKDGWTITNDEISPGTPTVAIFDGDGCELMWWTVKERTVR